jgi:DNA-binding transcriptional ArsR family regulator
MKLQAHPEPDRMSLTTVLAALSDPVRLTIVAAVMRGERGSSDFPCSVASSTLSHHIRALREAGILRHRKEGTRCFVSIRPEFEAAFPGLLETVLRFAPADDETLA